MDDAFARLYEQAQRRDCGALYSASALEHAFGPLPTEAVAAIVDDWQESSKEFYANLFDVAARFRMPMLDFEFRCQYCGSPDCPRAIPVRFIPANIYQHLLNGGEPIAYVDD